MLYKGKNVCYAVVTIIMGMKLVVNLYWSASDFHYHGLDEHQQFTQMADKIYTELKEENNGVFFRMEHEYAND